MRRAITHLILSFCLFGCWLTSTAQTTITTSGTAAYWATTTSAIVFGVRNTNAAPIIITDLANYSPASHSTTYTLWYRTNNLTGIPPDITTANGWVQVATATTTPVATAAIKPLFTGLSFTIPGNTTYRLALVAAANGPYYGSSGSSGNLFSGGGVEIYAQGNPISETYVGYFPGPVNNTPRTFYGSITFTLATANNAGIGAITDPPTPLCAGSYDIKAQVRNNGNNTLNSVVVNWSLDGVLQTPINYTTSIAAGNNVVLTLGNANFPTSVTRTIKVWTSQPNGVADPNNGDDTVTITRQAVGVAVATATAQGPTRFCPGGNVVLQANTGSSLSYQWKLNGNNITGATNSSYTATGNGNYSVEVKSSVCATLSNQVTVTVGPPSLNLGNDTAFCEHKSGFVLTAKEPNAKYLWSTGDTTQSIMINDIGGDYSVAVSLGPNCIARDTINLDISPLPRVTGMSYIKENAYTYFFEAAGAKYVQKYLWIFSDNQTDTGRTVTHVFPVGQHHSARLVISNNCGKDSVELQLPLSVASANGENGNISVYPNPASDKICVKTTEPFSDVTIINSVGAKVYDNSFENQREVWINTSGLAPGHYYLRVYTEKEKPSIVPIEIR